MPKYEQMEKTKNRFYKEKKDTVSKIVIVNLQVILLVTLRILLLNIQTIFFVII